MAATSRGGRSVLSALMEVTPCRTACLRCSVSRHSSSNGSLLFLRPAVLPSPSRPLSTAAATAFRVQPCSAAAAAVASSATEASSESSFSTFSSTTAAAAPAPAFRIRAGLLLSRPPLLTRDPTPFEAAFYLYQKRLNERLSTSFRKKVYFKPDTTLALDWRLQLRARGGTPARDIGVYAGGKGGGEGSFNRAVAWDDEVTVQDPLAAELTDPDRLRERIISDADLRVTEDGEPLPESDRIRVERPQPRRTAADEANDTRRLDRKLDRTLYLVVRGPDGSDAASASWSFPTVDVDPSENLHEAAARALESAAGVDMNTWMVGRVPVAHLVRSEADDHFEGSKTFFLKGRIMAGQANLDGNALGLTDFQWLTKEELAEQLSPSYYSSVKNAMPSR